MRVVIDEDIPASLTTRFRVAGHSVDHVEDLGLKGMHNGALLAAISGSADILVTGDASLGFQQNLKRFDLAIPEVVAAFDTAEQHEVTTIGRPAR